VTFLNANTVFELARTYAQEAGFGDEVNIHREGEFTLFSEQVLLRESAWVILCSGFRERTVRRVFDYISLCFFDWESAEEVLMNRTTCVRAATRCFRNERKLNAIVSCARLISERGFDHLKGVILSDPIHSLQRFPLIGPITVWHLAKNLGLDVAKPDRHLVRLAKACGFEGVHDLCQHLSEMHKESVKVVDLLLWRYLADHPHFLRPLISSR
jgi:hypothetical protein